MSETSLSARQLSQSAPGLPAPSALPAPSSARTPGASAAAVRAAASRAAARPARAPGTSSVRMVGHPLGHGPDRIDERRSEEHTSELQSRGHLVCRLLLEKKKTQQT